MSRETGIAEGHGYVTDDANSTIRVEVQFRLDVRDVYPGQWYGGQITLDRSEDFVELFEGKGPFHLHLHDGEGNIAEMTFSEVTPDLPISVKIRKTDRK